MLPEEAGEVIKEKADYICKTYRIKDNNAIVSILRDTYSDSGFSPSLEEALRYLAYREAAQVFTVENLEDLRLLEKAFGAIKNKFTDILTLSELESKLSNYLRHIEKDRPFAIKTGYPKRSFEMCRWLDWHLSPNYPTRYPAKMKDDEKDEEGNAVYEYYWQRLIWPTARGTHEEAGIIEEIDLEGIAREIERRREEFFDLKWSTLKEISVQLPYKKNGNEVVGICIDRITDALNIQDFLFYIKVDDLCSHIFNPQAQYSWGGMINLLSVGSHIAAECEEEILATIASKYSGIIGEYSSPYDLLKTTGEQEAFILSREILSAIERQRYSHSLKNEQIYNTLLTNLRSGFDITVSVRKQYEKKTKEYLTKLADFVAVHVEVAGGEFPWLLPKPEEHKGPSEKIKRLGIGKWEGITIRLLSPKRVSITMRGRTFVEDYKSMGMEDSRKKKPDVQWELLITLLKASEPGFLPWRLYGAKTEQGIGKLKKRKEKLSANLRNHFGIEEDPFYPAKNADGYRLKIYIDTSSGEETDVLDRWPLSLDEGIIGKEDVLSTDWESLDD
jgi:hypothetical protein